MDLTLSTSGSDYNTALAVWTGSAPGNLVEMGCTGTDEPITVLALSGLTLWIEIVQQGPAGGGQLQLQVGAVTMVGLRGDYFNNQDLAPPAACTRYDQIVDFDWVYGSPDPRLGADHFSVRWSGQVEAEYSETCTFQTLSDDGVRLWVDDQLLIDNWTTHGPTWDSGTIQLLAGQMYDVKLEYFEDGAGATIRLEWSSPSLAQEIIPSDRLSSLNLESSTVEASEIWADNGMPTSTVTVTLQTAGGFVVPNEPVYLQVSGSNNSLNGEPVSEGEWFLIGNSDVDGVIAANLTSTTAEVKTIQARSRGILIDDTDSVEFPPQEANGFQVLLKGESPAPGTPEGKTGEPDLIYSEKSTTFTIRAVDSDYNTVTGYYGTVLISLSDSTAKISESVDLVNGEAVVAVTWSENGFNSIILFNEPPPGEPEPTIFGFETLDVEMGLVVGNGETLTVDDERYAVTQYLTAGTSEIPYNSMAWINEGDEVLIITMSGEGIGTYEVQQVVSVGTDNLTISGPLIHDYNGINDRVMIQRIPNLTDVEVMSGSTITAHPWDGDTGGVVYFKAENLTVSSNGNIETDGLGFPAEEGPGAGSLNSGGSYGGFGGSYGGFGSSLPYGEFSTPMLMGSGGGYSDFYPEDARGGGMLRVEVSGTFANSGMISSNGLYGGWISQSGGSGGSLWITTDILMGEGYIQSNGGDGSEGLFDNYGPGGGGGRARLEVLTNNFTGSVQAYGGVGDAFVGSQGSHGGPGTIYWAADDHLVVDNNDLHGEAGLIEGTYDINTIELIFNGSLKVLGTGSGLTIDNTTISSDGTAWLSSQGTITGPQNFALDNLSLNVMGNLVGMDDLTINDGGNLLLHAQTPLHTGKHIFNTIAVNLNGTLTLAPYENGDDDYTNDIPLELEAAEINVATGGRITADELGYPSGEGPGAPSDYAGAGHGGFGGRDFSKGGVSGSPYGDVYIPSTLGSGDGYSSCAGGGAFYLKVNNTLDVDGIVTADGGNFGCSGGSIRIDTQTLSGEGTIRANGGGDSYGGGSGGRIALEVLTNNFTGSVEAFGGDNWDSYDDERNGGPGTIYWVNEDRLVVDNDGHSGQSAALLEGVYDIQTIELVGYGHLSILGEGSSSLLNSTTITGDGTATLMADGTLQVPTAFSIEWFGLDVRGEISGATDISLNNAGRLTLRIDTPLHTGGYTFEDILVKDGTVLTLVSYDSGDEDYTNDNPFELNVNTLTVEAGGVVSASGQGYTWITADGRGPGAGLADLDWDGSGAGHGGTGGDADYVEGGPTYGSTQEPITLGSSGGEGLTTGMADGY